MSVRRRSGVCFTLFVFYCFRLFSQEDASKDYSEILDPLQKLLENSTVYAIFIDLEVYNIEEGEKTLLTYERETRLTVHGSRVSLRYVVANVVIEGGITPYRSGEKQVNLVTQSEVWLKTKDGSDIHIPMFNNLNIRSGETLYYFPLGVVPDSVKNGFTIEIPIQVLVISNLEELSTLLDKINQND